MPQRQNRTPSRLVVAWPMHPVRCVQFVEETRLKSWTRFGFGLAPGVEAAYLRPALGPPGMAGA